MPGYLARVHQTPGKAVRVNVTFDEHLLSRIDAYTRQRGSTRSAFLADAARQVMGK